MYLHEIAKIIWGKGTASSDIRITVRIHDGDKRVLWNGIAKDLGKWDNVKGWIVVEVSVDKSIVEENHLPDYNRGKIITVI